MFIPQLLVSVRHPDEAHAALAGGADLIDIKEPSAGPLGMAPRETIERILHQVDRRRPVSAALGELADMDATDITSPPEALRYVKLGLANAPANWRTRLSARVASLGEHRFIAAAYADHARVSAPPVDDVLAWAVEHGVAGVLIDTAVKDGRGLLDWCDRVTLRAWIKTARQHDMLVALAGSLAEEALPRVLPLEADVIAVRGAACAQRDREDVVNRSAVRRLKQALAAPSIHA